MQAERAKQRSKAKRVAGGGTTHRPRAAMREDFLEYDEENVNAIKARAYGENDSDESFLSEEEAPASSRRGPALRNGRLEGESDDDEDDEEEEAVSHGSKKRRTTGLEEDDE